MSIEIRKDGTTQAEAIQKTTPRYRFIKASGEQEGDYTPTGSIFLYVGTNKRLVNDLTMVFDFGYSAENLGSAIRAVMKMDQDMSVIQTIILDIGYDLNELQELKKLLNATQGSLSAVPVLYNGYKLSNAERAELFKSKLADDIIDLEKLLPTLHERVIFLRKIKDALNHHAAVTIETNANRICEAKYVVKRLLDIVISSVLLVLLVPLFLVITLAIKAGSHGPVFYNVYRAGKGYQIFKFFKFRTMLVGADRIVNSMSQFNQYHKLRNNGIFKPGKDPRLTSVGAFLQSTRLDELPQLFNVLIGDMSIVGNKPLPLHEASSLTTDEWAERFIAPAGVTGLWKLRKKDLPGMSTAERLQLDIDYAKKYSLRMDFLIMLKTSGSFFKRA